MKKILFISLSVLSISSVMATELITGNVQNGCLASFDSDTYFKLSFNRHLYHCPNGYYLPANTTSCVPCAGTSYVCNGGDYYFNETLAQGVHGTKTLITGSITNGCTVENLRSTHMETRLTATWTPKQIVCNPGYYLKANTDVCSACDSVNKRCVGNIGYPYTFNENIAQGMEDCPVVTPYAPTGSAVCYPHILHVADNNVYLRSTKQTTPSLNVKIGNDIFYANMTTTRTPMNKDTTRYLHIDWGNNNYYVCDDTTYGQ